MRVDHNQESACGIHTKCDEALLPLSVRILPSQREVVLKDGHGVRKTYAMNLPVRFSFFGIPFVSHILSV